MQEMKSLLLGIVLIVVLGLGGFFYRNAVEHPLQPIACPLDAEVCPDGTSVSRTGSSCTFPACSPPNVSLDTVGVSFALPSGFAPGELTDAAGVAAYQMTGGATTSVPSSIIIRRYAIAASSTALDTIRATAIGSPSGLPVGATALTSSVLGSHRFTVVSIERFEGVIDTAYYLARDTDVLRFDAIDQNVTDWTDPTLDTTTLPTNAALRKLLATLQGR